VFSRLFSPEAIMLTHILSCSPSPSRPAEPTVDSQRVAEIAEKRLRNARCAELRHVSCLFTDGVLTLRGVVTSYYLKQIAQASVRDLDDVSQVQNLIRVCTATAE
jgi:osmotically-inducible protein OsmY